MSQPFDWEASEELVNAVAGKGTLRIVAELMLGPRQFNALARDVNLGHKPMGQRLRRLQEAGLVSRKIQDRPVRVEYRLTDTGSDLLPSLSVLARYWKETRF